MRSSKTRDRAGAKNMNPACERFSSRKREGGKKMRALFPERNWSWIIILILVPWAVCSCSKGSSGDYFLPITAEEELEYSGLTDPSALDRNNAQIILEEAFMGGTASAGMASPLGSVSADRYHGLSISPAQYAEKILELIEQAIDSMYQQLAPTGTSAVISQPIDMDGPCGGTCTGTLSIDDETGDLSGTLRYNDYCDAGITLDGRVSLTGTIDLFTGDMDMTMVFSNYSVEFEGVSQTMSGTVSLIALTDSSCLTMNIFVRDDSSGRTCWMRDYLMDVLEYSTYDELSVSGRFYDPDYGYVDLSTPTPFIVYETDDYPSEGSLVASGGGNTSARLVVLSVETYRIDVDKDGDGDYEWNSAVQYWEN